jgi:hypothetical protein
MWNILYHREFAFYYLFFAKGKEILARRTFRHCLGLVGDSRVGTYYHILKATVPVGPGSLLLHEGKQDATKSTLKFY